jgi:hypothetical protein
MLQNLDDRIKEMQKVSLNPVFLNTRIDAEDRARELLNSRSGYFTEDEFRKFLYLCNTEMVPQKPYTVADWPKNPTLTRFTAMFIGNNMKSIDTLNECNKWIALLWQSAADELNLLNLFWEKGEIQGAGTALPTMIMYLKDRETYNVWLPGLTKGLKKVIPADMKIGMTRSLDEYRKFNTAVNEFLRHKYNLNPQEIDYILFRLSQE